MERYSLTWIQQLPTEIFRFGNFFFDSESWSHFLCWHSGSARLWQLVFSQHGVGSFFDPPKLILTHDLWGSGSILPRQNLDMFLASCFDSCHWNSPTWSGSLKLIHQNLLLRIFYEDFIFKVYFFKLV